ncbi:MAG: hypothetical protein M3209_18975 [Acidobacteriota bacterium]|nr:hypothetical protein [Acidobacteriota bacterium]
MKLRVRNNSIRLRLTQPEVAAFAATGKVEEAIEFGLTDDKKLIYKIEKAEASSVRAEFEDGVITILVPTAQAENWTSTSEIGIKAEQDLGGEKTLKILIEKDFACLEAREGEEDNDAFPHPEQRKVC